ncbi:MAG: DUF3343 domain-containing protein [Oscillospiraceae bacterium]|nr:DUF3343 domain-containing protein [Oscillospiraceae bacterium]
MLCKAVMPSETYAIKAQRILAANGYRSDILRTTSRREGCSFTLRVQGNCEHIHTLLMQEGIPVQGVRIERDMP